MSYRRKHIKNKILKTRPKKSVFKMPIFWISLVVLALLFVGAYFLLFYPDLQVRNITINGNEKVNTEEVQNIISNNVNKKLVGFGQWGIYSKSIFLVNSEEIQKQILNSYPVIKSAIINKKLPQDLTAQIEERKQVAVFSQNNKYFYIDDSGVIFEELPNISENTFIVRQNLDTNNAFVGETVIQEKIMKAISEIEKTLKDNFQINLTEALISTPIRLDIKTGENWQIYFNIDSDSDIKLQLTKLNLLLKEQISQETRQKLEYVDLRFKDRAYYK